MAHPGGAHTHPVKVPGRSRNPQVSSAGQAPPQVGPPGSPVKHVVFPAGMQPQSKPPDTQTCPTGHAPSHSDTVPPHGCVPEMHWHVSPTNAQIGVSGGHSPQQDTAPITSPQGGPRIVVVVDEVDVVVDTVVELVDVVDGSVVG